jgi:hypothetical protein
MRSVAGGQRARKVFYDVLPARIKPYGTGEFEFDRQGIAAICVSIPTREGEPEDAVAWAVHNENAWWVRFRAVPLLGRENARVAATFNRALTVQATPYNWVLARGNGLCIIDWSADILPIIASVPLLVAETHDLADMLRARLGRFYGGRVRVADAAA